MTNRLFSRNLNFKLFLFIALALLSSVLINVHAQPTGVDIVLNETETIMPDPAAELTTAGGTFTTMVLNGTFQTPRWKAYVGNVSGRLALADSVSRTIYDWDLAVVSGQVYVSRHEEIDWSTITCADEQSILDEQSVLNIDVASVDSILNTFNETIHRGFFVGTVPITNSSCRAIATYVEDAKQPPSEEATFQEILLRDNANKLVFATIIEQGQVGYDGNLYDFQLIVPEDPVSFDPTTYFFFAEIY